MGVRCSLEEGSRSPMEAGVEQARGGPPGKSWRRRRRQRQIWRARRWSGHESPSLVRSCVYDHAAKRSCYRCFRRKRSIRSLRWAAACRSCGLRCRRVLSAPFTCRRRCWGTNPVEPSGAYVAGNACGACAGRIEVESLQRGPRASTVGIGWRPCRGRIGSHHTLSRGCYGVCSGFRPAGLGSSHGIHHRVTASVSLQFACWWPGTRKRRVWCGNSTNRRMAGPSQQTDPAAHPGPPQTGLLVRQAQQQ